MAEGCLPFRCHSSAIAEKWYQCRDKVSALSERGLPSGYLVSANKETKGLSGKNISDITEGTLLYNNCSNLGCVIAFVMRANSYLHCVRGFVIRANSEWSCVGGFVIRDNSNQVSVGGFIMRENSNRCCVMGIAKRNCSKLVRLLGTYIIQIRKNVRICVFVLQKLNHKSVVANEGQWCLEMGER